SCTDRRTPCRRSADHTGWLALDLSCQLADRPCGPVARLALRGGDAAPAATRNRPAGTDGSDSNTWRDRGRLDRRRRAGLEPSARARRLRDVARGWTSVCVARGSRATADAAAVAVRPSYVHADRAGRAPRQHRVLRADLRLQPLLPARQCLV